MARAVETRAEVRALQAERSSVLDRAEQAEGHGAEVALRLLPCCSGWSCQKQPSQGGAVLGPLLLLQTW